MVSTIGGNMEKFNIDKNQKTHNPQLKLWAMAINY